MSGHSVNYCHQFQDMYFYISCSISNFQTWSVNHKVYFWLTRPIFYPLCENYCKCYSRTINVSLISCAIWLQVGEKRERERKGIISALPSCTCILLIKVQWSLSIFQPSKYLQHFKKLHLLFNTCMDSILDENHNCHPVDSAECSPI